MLQYHHFVALSGAHALVSKCKRNIKPKQLQLKLKKGVKGGMKKKTLMTFYKSLLILKTSYRKKHTANKPVLPKWKTLKQVQILFF